MSLVLAACTSSDDGTDTTAAATTGTQTTATAAPSAREDDVEVAAAGTDCRDSTALPDPASPELDCAAPPSTFDGSTFFGQGATAQAMAGPTFDAWAWSAFAAFNWPVVEDSSQPTGYLRGIPATGDSASFVTAQFDDVLVWETFKEKREIFNGDVASGQWQEYTFTQEQSVEPDGGAIPACPGVDVDVSNLSRHMQAAKLPAVNENAPLDETAEVASPAQEPAAKLCAGYPDCPFVDPPGGGPTDPFPPTEPNPRPPVGPRVYDSTTGDIVYYEVKLNYDYYDFVTDPPNLPNGDAPPGPYNIDSNAFATAQDKNMTLPYRTSAPNATGQGTPPSMRSTLGYEAGATASEYGGAPATPPPVGSVQLKAAWKLLPEADPDYHVTQALYFTSTPQGPDGLCYNVGTFGLIGLHIIQRVHLGDSNSANAQPWGGTYVFATWEHISVDDGAGYKYVNFLTTARDSSTPYPTLDNAIQVTREQGYPLATTQAVTEAVWGQLPEGSVWLNYRLIGTQFLAIGSEEDSATYNQPYYLANLVIETNDGLQNFQGLPPNVTPVQGYSNKFMATGTTFEPSFPNVPFNVNQSGGPIVMGGCMGCHGVAQLNGYNFSFVLQDGQRGAGIDTPTHIEIPPDPPSADD